MFPKEGPDNQSCGPKNLISVSILSFNTFKGGLELDEPIINLKNIHLRIGSVTLTFTGERPIICLYEGSRREGEDEIFRYRCKDALVDARVSTVDDCSALIGLSVASLKTLDSMSPFELDLDVGKPSGGVLVLTTHKDAAKHYSSAFGYYNQLAINREPKAPKPPEDPEYPPLLGFISHDEYMRSYPCWTYPVISRDLKLIPYYSIFLLADYGGKYMAVLTFTDGCVTTYLDPGPKLRAFLGKDIANIDLSWVASVAVDEDPYKAVERCVMTASSRLPLKPRERKRTPIFMEKIGWCSWNALLTEDLSHENIVKIVRGILDRGIRLGWVIIDDGWQDEVKRDGWPRRILKRLSTNERFPAGLMGAVRSLKNLGIDLVGLWHTINIHWSGFEKNLSRDFSVAGYFSKFNESYVPPPKIDEAFKLYERFFKWVRCNDIDFVKADNQWVIHALYNGDFTVGESSRNIELAMQAAAYANGLDIINCMSMAPENYSNFLFSNIMRVSIDYIPFWKADAKLHTIFSVYNALLFGHIAYPDYDMFMSYDPYALVHAVARIFSCGPFYITDREPERTNIELLKRFVLPDGRLVRVCEPAMPTRDVLFRDPYNEPVLLKVASKVGEGIAIAAFNVSRSGARISDSITLNMLPFSVKRQRYAYYRVFGDEYGILEWNDELNISLGELEVEVVVLSPIEGDKAVIGLKEFILPPSPIRIFRTSDGRVWVQSMASGTLLYYADGRFVEKRIEEGSTLEIC